MKRTRLGRISIVTRFNRPRISTTGIEEKIAAIAQTIYTNAMELDDHETWTHFGIGGNKEMQRAVRVAVRAHIESSL